MEQPLFQRQINILMLVFDFQQSALSVNFDKDIRLCHDHGSVRIDLEGNLAERVPEACWDYRLRQRVAAGQQAGHSQFAGCADLQILRRGGRLHWIDRNEQPLLCRRVVVGPALNFLTLGERCLIQVKHDCTFVQNGHARFDLERAVLVDGQIPLLVVVRCRRAGVFPEMNQRAVVQLTAVQIEPFAVRSALEAIRTVRLLVDANLLRICTGFLLQLRVEGRKRGVLADDIILVAGSGDVIKLRCVDHICGAADGGVAAVSVFDDVERVSVRILQLEDCDREGIAVLVQLLQVQRDSSACVGEHDLVQRILDNDACGVCACADDAVDRVRRGIAGGAVFDDGVACADRQVQNFQMLSGLQLEAAAGMEIKLINSDAVCVIAIAGMIVRERAAV